MQRSIYFKKFSIALYSVNDDHRFICDRKSRSLLVIGKVALCEPYLATKTVLKLINNNPSYYIYSILVFKKDWQIFLVLIG